MPKVELEITTKGAKAGSDAVKNIGNSAKTSRVSVHDLATTMVAAAQAIDRMAGAAKQLQADAIAAFAGFDQAMMNTQSIAVGTQDDFDELRKMAQQMSTEMPASAEEIAAGYYTLASAGKEANEIMAMTPAIMKLATATASDFETTAGLVTAVMDIYGDKVGDANEVSDVLMNTVKGFKTTLDELGGSLKYSAGAAATVGVEFEVLAAATGLLRGAGLEASQAGTGMSKILMKLSKVTPEASEVMAKYGMEIKKNTDGTLDLVGTMENFNSALAETAPLEKMNIMQTLFGEEAAKSAIALISQSDQLGELSGKMGEAGSVQNAFNIQMEGTANQLQVMQNRMELAQAELGEKMLPATLALTEAKLGLYKALTSLPGPLGDVAGGAIVVVSEFGGMIASIMMMVPGMVALKNANIKATFSAGAHAIAEKLRAMAMGTSSAATAKVTIATYAYGAALYALPLVAVAAAFMGVGYAIDEINSKIDEMADAQTKQTSKWREMSSEIRNAEDALKGLEATYDALESKGNEYSESMSWLNIEMQQNSIAMELLRNSGNIYQDVMDGLTESNKELSDEIMQNEEAISSLMSKDSDQAEALGDLGDSNDLLRLKMMENQLAMDKLSKAGKEGSDEMMRYKDANEELRIQMSENQIQIQKLRIIEKEEAEEREKELEALKTANEELTKSMKENSEEVERLTKHDVEETKQMKKLKDANEELRMKYSELRIESEKIRLEKEKYNTLIITEEENIRKSEKALDKYNEKGRESVEWQKELGEYTESFIKGGIIAAGAKAVGWDIPGFQKGTGLEGVPKTALYGLHKDEIVLNPAESNVFRDLIETPIEELAGAPIPGAGAITQFNEINNDQRRYDFTTTWQITSRPFNLDDPIERKRLFDEFEQHMISRLGS